MATTGKQAWEKYYKNAGDVSTVIRRDAKAYDAKTFADLKTIIPRGTSVVVKKSSQYDKKMLVTYKNKYDVRVDIDDIQKPIAKGTIGNKILTPDGLGLGGKKIAKQDYIRVVGEAVQKQNLIPQSYKNFLMDFLTKSAKESGTLDILVEDLPEKDLKVIAKDFGEISGAWWFVNNYDKELKYIEFPSSVSNPLVDYYVEYSNGIKLNVSSKSGKGAAPSLKPVWAIIQNKNFSGEEATVKNFIKEIAENDGLESIIKASKHYNSTAYRLVKDIIGKSGDYDSKDLEEWLKRFVTPQEAYEFLWVNFYKKINRTPNLKSFEEIFYTNRRKSGLFLSPMAYNLVEEVNRDKTYVKFLTKICKSLAIEQLYLSLNGSSKMFNYKLLGFKDSEFIFEYHSNAINPGANKIGFVLKK